MGKSRVRWPIGAMIDSSQPSSSRIELQTRVPPARNSTSSQYNDNTTDLDLQEPLGDSSNQTTRKRKRGSAWQYRDWGTGKKLVVKLNEDNQPIGDTASQLASQLGVIARSATLCPIIYTDWRCKQLKPFKERIWQDVKDNCEVSDAYEDTCLKSVGKKWRHWKERLKRDHYSIYDNDAERLANVPERVDAKQWKIFVKHQGSNMAMERSRTNRENQKKKAMAHTSGRKSHVVVRAELIAKGKKGDRIEVYFATHMKGGKPVDQAAAEAIAALNGKLETVPDADQTPEFREKVFTDVLGIDNHGRVRTKGIGPCPSKIFGKKNITYHDLERARQVGREEGREEREEFRQRIEYLESLVIHDRGYKGPKSPRSISHQQVSDAESSHNQSVYSTSFLFEVGMKVQLLNNVVPKKVIAEGIILSKDPRTKVGGSPIGDGFWEVQIVKAVLSNEPLLIGRPGIRKVGQAVKKSVPWRSHDVKEM